MTDPLAMWWRFDVTVQRFAGEGSNGPRYDPPVVVRGRITTKRKLVRSSDGAEVVSEARISLPALTTLIPAQSLVTLPAEFGGRTATVITDQLHHSGMDTTPNFYSIDLT